MGRPSKLTLDQRESVIALAAKGWSSARIAKHAKGTWGVTIAASSLRELVRRGAAEVATKRRTAARANVGTAPARTPLERLERNARRLERHIKLADEKGDASLVARLIETHRKVLDQIGEALAAETPNETIDGIASLIGLAHEDDEERRRDPKRWAAREGEWLRERLEALAKALGKVDDAGELRKALEGPLRALGSALGL